ncbi:MAG: hypothetical protein DCF15_09530 [Phormidesmis priestleyi]|uniref:Uncharacterized protein n=1 Tax=Phormidesmis priestleyi TaxID=268141 RepID=A0A2W4XIZ2_9CYAN|nr:MAG: hypothetical protein DCF15_09530 [Phormidesmis priestleyi]
MSERLDQIEAILLATAERQNEMNASLQQTQAALERTQAVLDRTAQQQASNTSDIDTLLGAVSTNEVEIRAPIQQMAESNRLFDVLRQDAIADRRRSDQRFEAMQENIQRLFLELHSTNRRVDTLEQAS